MYLDLVSLILLHAFVCARMPPVPLQEKGVGSAFTCLAGFEPDTGAGGVF